MPSEEEQLLEIAKRRGLSATELERVLSSLENTARPRGAVPYQDYIGDRHFKIGIISDTHIGHKQFREDLFKYAGQRLKSEGVVRVFHCGDLLEGMSGRPGHVYELSQIGFQQQADYAEWLIRNYFDGLRLRGINGNHDLWYAKKNNGGLDVSAEMEKRLGRSKWQNLGSEEADVWLGKGIKLRLFHANDGTAYADSYKMQKLMESFDAGQKPQILASGHYHKALYMFRRNIHGLEAGTLCGQTEWMRGKKIPAHMGFWILEVEQSRGKKGGVGSLVTKFFPAYD